MTPFDDPRFFPDAVERFWRELAREQTGKTDEAEALDDLVPRVQEVSDAFTRERDAAGPPAPYDLPARLTAYGLFFFPQSWVRCRFPVVEALDARGLVLPGDRPLRLLDIGAGTGAAGLGIGHLLRGRGVPRIELTAIDSSSPSMIWIHRLAQLIDPEGVISVETRRMDAAAPLSVPGRFDLIVVGFSLNEWASAETPEQIAARMDAWVDLLTPSGLLVVVEPAFRQAALPLRAGLDLLHTAYGRACLGPYFPAAPCCPFLAEYAQSGREPESWSHEVRTWQAPPMVEYLNRRLWRDIQHVRFAYGALSPQLPPGARRFPEDERILRVTSPVLRKKGYWLLSGVTGDGRVVTCQWQRRDFAKADGRWIERIERGDLLEFHELQRTGDPRLIRVPGPEALLRHDRP